MSVTTVAYTTETGKVSGYQHVNILEDIARAARRARGQRTTECPGCTGEASKSVGVMLGCTFCAA